MKTTTLSAWALVATTLSPLVLGAWQADTIHWPQLLAETNLDEREVHFEALVERAGEDPELRAQLDEWAAGTDELAWTARLARRELERAERHPLGRWHDPSGRSGPLGAFGPGFDPFADFEGDFGSGLGVDFERLFEDLRNGSALGGPLPLDRSQQQSFSLQQTPDGVRIEIESEVDGDKQSQVYEGDSLADLLAAHPELEEHLGGSPHGWRFGAGARPFGRSGSNHAGPFSWRPFGSRASTPRRDVLGVSVSKPADGSDGLWIHHVVPGSLAAGLGLRAGETLIELDGRAIAAVEDVAAALAERDPSAVLKARVLGAEGVERELEWTPDSEPSEAEPGSDSPFPIDRRRRL